jgi:hypothetical protein
MELCRVPPTRLETESDSQPRHHQIRDGLPLPIHGGGQLHRGETDKVCALVMAKPTTTADKRSPQSSPKSW